MINRILNVIFGLTLIMLVNNCYGAELEGFRGIYFGTNLSDINQGDFDKMDEVNKLYDDGCEYYIRLTDNTTIGGVKMKYILYGFYNGKLDGIRAMANDDNNNFNKLVYACRLNYGKEAMSLSESLYQWVGNKCILTVEHNIKDESIWFRIMTEKAEIRRIKNKDNILRKGF